MSVIPATQEVDAGGSDHIFKASLVNITKPSLRKIIIFMIYL
jgi:hypothetical protein